MPHPHTLLTCALRTTSLLRSHSIPHAFFGGFTTTTLGCPRQTKDLDILIHTTKSDLVALLTAASPHYLEVSQAREDYVAFLWSGIPGTFVLVEFFFYTGPAFPQTWNHRHFTSGAQLPFLEPFQLFLGKLAAASGRAKSSDDADLLFLMKRFPRDIERGLSGLRARSRSLQRLGFGKADGRGKQKVLEALTVVAGRSPEVGQSARRMGFKVGAGRVGDERGRRGGSMERGEVQRGLVC